MEFKRLLACPQFFQRQRELPSQAAALYAPLRAIAPDQDDTSNRAGQYGVLAMETSQPQSCVAYYRVSTQKQGRSGLGLEAQQSAVRDHLDRTNRKLVAELIEIESGKKSRPAKTRRSAQTVSPHAIEAHRCEA